MADLCFDGFMHELKSAGSCGTLTSVGDFSHARIRIRVGRALSSRISRARPWAPFESVLVRSRALALSAHLRRSLGPSRGRELVAQKCPGRPDLTSRRRSAREGSRRANRRSLVVAFAAQPPRTPSERCLRNPEDDVDISVVWPPDHVGSAALSGSLLVPGHRWNFPRRSGRSHL